MLAEPVDQGLVQAYALSQHAIQHAAVHDFLDHRVGSGAGDGMAEVCMPVLEKARALFDRLVNPAGTEHRADRLIPGTQSFCDRHDIRRNAVLVAGVQAAGPTHTAHDFVENQQYAVLIADFANAFEIAVYRGYRTKCRTDYRFRDEGHYLVFAEAQDFGFELVCDALTVFKLGLVGLLPAVSVTGCDVRSFDHQRIELFAPPQVTAGSQGTQGVAMIGLHSRYHAVT